MATIMERPVKNVILGPEEVAGMTCYDIFKVGYLHEWCTNCTKFVRLCFEEAHGDESIGWLQDQHPCLRSTPEWLQ